MNCSDASNGRGARFSQKDGVWRTPSGYFELGQLEGPGDYSKYQGRSFTLLMVDEAGQYATPDLIDKLRSNMRGPAGMPIRQAIYVDNIRLDDKLDVPPVV